MSTEFQERLIRALDDHPGVPAEGWNCKAQFRARVGDRMQYPDLIFYHQAPRRLILVEVKLHAVERHNQSHSYARDGFLQAFREKWKDPDLALTYRWLTPDGWRPEAEIFQPVTFSRLAAALRPCTLPEPRLSFLVHDFIALVDELEDRTPPPDVPVREFIEERRLLTYSRNLGCFGRALQVGGIGAPAPVRQELVESNPQTRKRLPCPYYQWILRDGDVALELVLQGEQRGDPTALTLTFQYHCWDKQALHEKKEPGWTQRYTADRAAYRNRIYCHMDRLKHSGWQLFNGDSGIARKTLAVTESCSKVIDDANRAIAELLRVLEELGDPVTP